MTRRFVALTCWAFLTWVLITWTLTAEQMAFGVGIAGAVSFALLPIGRAAGPWRLLEPARLWGVVRIGATSLRRMVVANVVLARRIWTPSLPIRPGMLIVPTRTRTTAGLTAVGVLTSLVVDNQLVDVDVEHHELLYHAIWVDSTEPEAARDEFNGPIEDLVVPLEVVPGSEDRSGGRR